MKSSIYITVILFLYVLSSFLSLAGTWTDDFSGEILSPHWHGNRENFSIVNGRLKGTNAHPILLLPLKWIEIGENWDNYTIECRINVVTPNLLECSKGALILRHRGNEGYVFALHVATKTVEIFRLSNGEMLLSKEEPLELETWYNVRAELQDDKMSFFLDDKLIGKTSDKRVLSGSVGLAVQDVLEVLFDDIKVSGPGILPNPTLVNTKSLPVTWAYIKKQGL